MNRKELETVMVTTMGFYLAKCGESGNLIFMVEEVKLSISPKNAFFVVDQSVTH